MVDTQQITPHVTFITGNCACSSWNFCLWHYSKFPYAERAAIRKQLGIRDWSRNGAPKIPS